MVGYAILIIDDDPYQHAIMDKYLKISGYDVLHANDGAEGLKILGDQRPDRSRCSTSGIQRTHDTRPN